MNVADGRRNPLGAVYAVLGAAGGWAMSDYTGSALWVPSGSAVLLFLLFTKTRAAPQYFRGAIAVTAGHLIWFTVAGALTGDWAAVALDIVVTVAALAFLWLRPGLPSALLLGVAQSLMLAYNVVFFFGAEVGGQAHRALTVHCSFRALALGCLVAGYWQLKKERAEATLLGAHPSIPSSSAPTASTPSRETI